MIATDFQRPLFLAVFLILAGCGGGSDGSSNNPFSTINDPGNSTDNSSSGGIPSSPVAVVTLEWDPPVERVDGTFLFAGEINGYRVEYGFAMPDLSAEDGVIEEILIASASTTRQDLFLEPGAYYFKIGTVDLNGLNSAYSDPIFARIQ